MANEPAKPEAQEPEHTPGRVEVLEGSAGMVYTVGSPYGHGPMHIADMRGWGHLTGQGACRFTAEKAAAIQDANARRWAASWNALLDLKTSDVEAGVVGDLVEAAKALLKYAERNECHHEETHRGGFIWTFCDGCGQRWADDRGGFQPYEEPAEFEAARAVLARLGEGGGR